MVLFGLAVLYRFGPDLDNPYWRWISPGAVFAAVAWLIGSGLLSWYLASFANYNKTYGSLGAGIGMMMWLWMTAIVVLVGAEFNSAIDAVEHPVRTQAQERIG
jgi:membrane protein